ncbi:MAG: histone deacetylase family protein [Gammaproteobacteria bacterium]|jgi:acetoin utilization deacetylase AcuC-like enzyme
MLPGHPESPERLKAIAHHLATTGQLAELDVREPPLVDDAVLTAIHDRGYIDELEALSPSEGLVAVDPDTALNPYSLAAARRAGGAVVEGVRQVVDGPSKRAFCAVRPPGHHAESNAAMGFCLFNSVALGAEAALRLAGIERVAILDFDVHHGNGTVEIFQDREEVLVCSSFQHPYYPHRYYDIDRPNIVNTPLPAGTGSRDFRLAVEADWLPALERHRPHLILVSAGFDAHRLDPLAALELDEEDFRWVTALIVGAADTYANGRIVATLEGGYHLEALARSVAVHLETLSA